MPTVVKKKWTSVNFKNVGSAGLKKDLAAFEKKYGWTTQAFIQKIEHGELEESNDFIDWLGLAQIDRHIQMGER